MNRRETNISYFIAVTLIIMMSLMIIGLSTQTVGLVLTNNNVQAAMKYAGIQKMDVTAFAIACDFMEIIKKTTLQVSQLVAISIVFFRRHGKLFR